MDFEFMKMTEHLNYFNKLGKKVKKSTANFSNKTQKKQGRIGKETSPPNVSQIWSKCIRKLEGKMISIHRYFFQIVVDASSQTKAKCCVAREMLFVKKWLTNKLRKRCTSKNVCTITPIVLYIFLQSLRILNTCIKLRPVTR